MCSCGEVVIHAGVRLSGSEAVVGSPTLLLVTLIHALYVPPKYPLVP